MKEHQGIKVDEKGVKSRAHWPVDPNLCCRYVCDTFTTNILILKPSKNKLWTLGDNFENVETYFKYKAGTERLQILRIRYVI